MTKDIERFIVRGIAGAMSLGSLLLLDPSCGPNSSPEPRRIVLTQEQAEAKMLRLTQARAYADEMITAVINHEIITGMRPMIPMNSASEQKIPQGQDNQQVHFWEHGKSVRIVILVSKQEL